MKIIKNTAKMLLTVIILGSVSIGMNDVNQQQNVEEIFGTFLLDGNISTDLRNFVKCELLIQQYRRLGKCDNDKKIKEYLSIIDTLPVFRGVSEYINIAKYWINTLSLNPKQINTYSQLQNIHHLNDCALYAYNAINRVHYQIKNEDLYNFVMSQYVKKFNLIIEQVDQYVDNFISNVYYDKKNLDESFRYIENDIPPMDPNLMVYLENLQIN